MDGSADFELERDGRHVTLSVRAESGNFVLTIPLDGATTLVAAASRCVDENVENSTHRFQLKKAVLQVSR